MSALTDPTGFRLTTLVEMQRGLSDFEAAQFLITEELPDLSQPPVDPGAAIVANPDAQIIPLSDVQRWLAGDTPASITASSFLGLDKSHSASLNGETSAFKFNPNQPRDDDGKWVEFPGGGGGIDLPGVKAPTPAGKKTSGKKATPAVIYKKHADGTVVAETGDSRMRWDAGAKKFVVEERAGADWQETSQLTKSAAYNELKTPNRWFEPGDAPVSTPTSEPTVQEQVTPLAPKPPSAEEALTTLNAGVRRIADKFGVDLADGEIGTGDAPAHMDLKTGKISINPAEVGRLEKFRDLKISLGGRLDLDVDVWTEAGVHEGSHGLAHQYLTPDEQVEALRRGAIAAGLPPPSDKASMVSSYGWSTQLEQETQTDYERGTGVISQALSNYGSFSMHEALGEALTEYTLVDEPRPFARAVGDYVRERINAQKNGQTDTNIETVAPPQTPEVAPTNSQPTAETTSVPSAYTGPQFELPEDLDLAMVDRYRELVRKDMDGTATTTDKYELYDLNNQFYNYPSGVRTRLYREVQNNIALDDFMKEHGITTPRKEYIKQLRDRVKSDFADKKIAVRVTPKNLENILTDGRFKSQFESGTSKGSNDTQLRARVEHEMFGIPEDISFEPEKRPIYGYVMLDGIRPAGVGTADLFAPSTDALSQYGQIQVVLKDDVRTRTTAMYGDSLNNSHSGRPSPVNNPTWESFTPANKSMVSVGLATPNRDIHDTQFRYNNYAEAQVHGGVNTSDIAEVIFPTTPGPAIRKLLEKQNVPWRVLNFKTAATASPEERDNALRIARQDIAVLDKQIADAQDKLAEYEAKGHKWQAHDIASDIKTLTTQRKRIGDALLALEKSVAQKVSAE